MTCQVPVSCVHMCACLWCVVCVCVFICESVSSGREYLRSQALLMRKGYLMCKKVSVSVYVCVTFYFMLLGFLGMHKQTH